MESSGIYVVELVEPLPNIVSTSFVFYNINEAFEFQSCIHSQYPDATTEMREAGTPQEIFEHWSF